MIVLSALHIKRIRREITADQQVSQMHTSYVPILVMQRICVVYHENVHERTLPNYFPVFRLAVFLWHTVYKCNCYIAGVFPATARPFTG